MKGQQPVALSSSGCNRHLPVQLASLENTKGRAHVFADPQGPRGDKHSCTCSEAHLGIPHENGFLTLAL